MPDILKCTSKYSSKVYSWDDVKNLSDCQLHDFADILKYQAEVTDILAHEEQRQMGTDVVSRAMRYGLTAPHSEGIPYYISGLLRLFEQENIGRVVIFGLRDRSLGLMEGAATSRSIPVIRLTSFGAVLFGLAARIHMELGRFKRHGQALARWLRTGRGSELPAVGEILICFDKPRALRLWSPIIKSLELMKLRSSVSIVCPNGLKGFYSPVVGRRVFSFLVDCVYSYLRYRRIWRAAEPTLRRLPAMYRGVRIAPFHTEDMRDCWLNRAFAASIVGRSVERFLDVARPAVLCFNEPLEASVLIAQGAAKRKIPVLFHHPFYTGDIAMASIWEENLRAFQGEFCTVNEWQAARLVVKGLARREHIHVAGDILAGIIRRESKNVAGLKERLGIDSSKKIICFLSRPVSSALSDREKKWMLRELSGSASELGAALLIKGHPHERREILEQEVRSAGASGTIVISEVSLGAALGISDIAVGTPESASNLDAIYAGVPLIIGGDSKRFDRFDGLNERYSYRKFRACLCVVDGQPFLPVVKLLLNNDSARAEWLANATEFTRIVSASNTGDAADVIAGCISRLVHV